MKPKRVVILGATGSIGDSALKVAHDIPERMQVVGLAANSNVEKLAAAANRVRPAAVCLTDETHIDALRKALEKFYPQLREVKLLDYKVRVLAANQGTESKVRVLIESGDHKDKWGTVGVSENIMEASWQALADSIEYKLLLKDR